MVFRIADFFEYFAMLILQREVYSTADASKRVWSSLDFSYQRSTTPCGANGQRIARCLTSAYVRVLGVSMDDSAVLAATLTRRLKCWR
jgi:hypothetical protein